MYETLGEGPKFRGEISLGNTAVRLKRRSRGGPSEKKLLHGKFLSFSLSPIFPSFSPAPSPFSFPREHATRCRECRLAPLEASRTLVAVLVFPFSRPPGDEDENDDDVSFGRVFGETSLTRTHADGIRERRAGPDSCSL